MNDVDNFETLDDTNAFLDNTFTNLDLGLDMKKMYDVLGNENIKSKLDDKLKLSNLRNKNYKNYNEINILRYKNLPPEFDDLKKEILLLYNGIDVRNLLTDNYENSKSNEKVLNDIYIRILRLDNVVKSYLKQLTRSNDEKQKMLNRPYFNNLDIEKKEKNELIEKYNDLVLHSSSISKDIYKELEIQYKRKQYIDDILRILNIIKEQKNRVINKEKLDPINLVISMEIDKYKNKIQYLQSMISDNSIYAAKFEEFKDFFNKLICYDKDNYENAKQTFDILVNDNNLKNNIKTFEELFASEKENINKQSQIIKDSEEIKKFKESIEYISSNYSDKLLLYDNLVLKKLRDSIMNDNYDKEEFVKALERIVKNIWASQITDVYSYNPNEDYYFICSNNQFIDKKYQTVLITKKELEKSKLFDAYQIGFICAYNDNILYTTEKDDIMSVNGDNMLNLKTPLQIEQELMKFNVCNKIALDGTTTKLQAVYFINDGDYNKYYHALELANMYNLPLIELKK